MGEREFLINFKEWTELIKINNSGTITVADILTHAQHRFYESLGQILADTDCLCEGPYASKPIDDARLNEIEEMLKKKVSYHYFTEKTETKKQPLQLWVCNSNETIFVCFSYMLIFYIVLLGIDNGFLCQNITTAGQQNHSGGIITPNTSVISKDVDGQPRNLGNIDCFLFIYL
jgi:hypothetical protein